MFLNLQVEKKKVVQRHDTFINNYKYTKQIIHK